MTFKITTVIVEKIKMKVSVPKLFHRKKILQDVRGTPSTEL